jgi:phosphatidate cytidylyltransferase
MAPPAKARKSGLSNLQIRLISAAVLLPVVTAAIIFGHPYFTALIAAFAGVAMWEWGNLVAHARVPGTTAPAPAGPSRASAVWAAIVVGAAMPLVGAPSPARMILLVGALALWLVLVVISSHRRLLGWDLAGIFYIGTAAAALVLIRNEPEWGVATLLWIIGLVVAADTGGYIAGRSIGGPKLAPRISPNKTWAGLGGAVAGAALVGLLTAFIVNHTNVWVLVLLSAALGLIEQAGDLVESARKRHFGVKDASHIIPGHGGVLDRIDGLLAVAVAVLVIGEWTGRSVLIWS